MYLVPLPALVIMVVIVGGVLAAFVATRSVSFSQGVWYPGEV